MDKKWSDYLYYALIGVISIISLLFLPMIGSDVGLAFKIPNTFAGWIVFITSKLIVATLNILIFHCFIKQAKVNVKDNPKYKEAKELLESILHDEIRENVLPKSPKEWHRKQYESKGITLFITTILGTLALTQAILTYDWMVMLTYLFTIVMSLIFGIIEMKSTEQYWTEEYPAYAKMVKEEMEMAKTKHIQQTNDSASHHSGDNLLESCVGDSNSSHNDIGMVVDSNRSSDSILVCTSNSSNCTPAIIHLNSWEAFLDEKHNNKTETQIGGTGERKC